MTTKLQKLQREARAAAKRRGHDLGRFQGDPHHGGVRFANCRHMKCGAGVVVDQHPLPNGIEVGGEAVALNCRKGPKA